MFFQKFEFTSEEVEIIKKISQAAAQQKVECYLIGGFVRDKFLKRNTKDIDVVCLGNGISFAQQAAQYFSAKIVVSVFKNFGTAMFKYKHIDIEFVGARKESYERNSRNPIVENGTLSDDQRRRDFTINTLAISLNESNYGELIDPFGGLEDLKLKKIITPLNADITFSDDPLRMLRAIRFATQLNFQIAPTTFESIAKNKDRIKILSQERITDELNKIIEAPLPSVGFKMLFKTELLHLIFPELVNLHGVEFVNGRGHKDNFFHTLQVLDNLSKNTTDLWLRWAALLHDIAKPATKRFEKKQGWTFHGHEVRGAKMVSSIFKRLKLPTTQKMKYVEKLVLLHLRPIALNNKNITDAAIRRLLFDAGDNIDDLMKLCEADITTKDADKMARYLKNFELVRKKLIEIEQKDQIRNYQPPVSGEIIMNYFNLKPGRMVGEIKNAIKEAILDGQIGNNFDEAHNFMLKKAQEFGIFKKY